MRIAILTQSARMAGGVESYLDTIIPMLEAAGHEISLLCEADAPPAARAISRAADAPLWCAAQLGAQRTLELLRQWRPELVYSHGLADAEFEARALTLAPSMVFAHDYRAICVSGSKTFSFPGSTPCTRRLGAGCVANFYPRRCGGLNPLTMLADFRNASRRLATLRNARAVLVASEYVRTEYLRNGLSPDAVHCVGLPIVDRGGVRPTTSKIPAGVQKPSPVRLVFAGRMEPLKGGQILLDALPSIAAALARPVVATFAGDGRARFEWARRADVIARSHLQLRIEFTGWLDAVALNSLFDSADLLVLPSLWPEPFGLVGPEAGIRGLPAAAFAVGGIPEWLSDGVNGAIARGFQSASSLADAVVRCLRDPVEHVRLRRGAIEQAKRFSPQRHLNFLARIIEAISTQATTVRVEIPGRDSTSLFPSRTS
jgi:glycosyltransferase involved in cell wall biosynthesis